MNHENKTFTGETVPLDGDSFRHCAFVDCVVTYSGGQPPTLYACDFTGTTRFQFEGAAHNVLVFMTAMYHGGLRGVIENTVDAIRKNTMK